MDRENELDEREASLHVHHWLASADDAPGAAVAGPIPGSLATPVARREKPRRTRGDGDSDSEASVGGAPAPMRVESVDSNGPGGGKFGDGWAGTVRRIEMEALDVEHRVAVETKADTEVADRRAQLDAEEEERRMRRGMGPERKSMRDKIESLKGLGVSSRQHLIRLLERERHLEQMNINLSSEVLQLREERATRALAYLCLSFLVVFAAFCYAVVVGVNYIGCDASLEQPVSLWHVVFGCSGLVMTICVPACMLKLATSNRRSSSRRNSSVCTNLLQPCFMGISCLLVLAPAVVLAVGVWWAVAVDTKHSCAYDVVGSLRALCIGVVVFIALQPLVKVICVGQLRSG